MKNQVKKASGDVAKSPAGMDRQSNQAAPGDLMSDNRHVMSVQRKLREVARNSPGAMQLQAMQNTINHSKQNTVMQMAFDANVKPGALNVIGENHNKDKPRRLKEAGLAKKNGLNYLTENEFTVTRQEKEEKGDPTHLRILFAIAGIKENLAKVENLGIANAQKYISAVKWIIENVRNDIDDYAETSESNAIVTEYRKLITALNTVKKPDADAAIDKISQIISPGFPLGGSRGLSMGRSDAMHSAATDGKASLVMWMIGQNHATDIEEMFPSREYVLLDEKNMDLEISKLDSEL